MWVFGTMEVFQRTYETRADKISGNEQILIEQVTLSIKIHNIMYDLLESDKND